MYMTRNEYIKYINSETWENKRQTRLLFDDFMCQMCGSRGTQINPLQIHHMTYKNLGHETMETDLVTLCSNCHKAVHKMMNRKTTLDGRRGFSESTKEWAIVVDETQTRT